MSGVKSSLPSHIKATGSIGGDDDGKRHHGKTQSHMAFENTSTNIAAAQMRNALTELAETVTDPAEKKASPIPPFIPHSGAKRNANTTLAV
ncbi:hypothetical protein SPBR_05419 [Sporothrix brasiliensis 5110]|uniref:Uncharacterized protein n=1 Tax=Sporothrix brasiliensis 5110 TaxID=1398154 RepID=A0A0C2IEH4_9PEZI|nr:uncharacterized protein SPBR_05419 [Sporothrix brasiliensis 5110]KIH87641.1 hypothetical protein SPBR_05419 [Sporothrix brasiliensis 5110]